MFKIYKGSRTIEVVVENNIPYIIWDGDDFSKKRVSKSGANDYIKAKYADGWKKANVEKHKVASPKKPKVEKTPKTREQSLTEKYGSKEQRAKYIKTKNICKSLWNRRLNAETTLKGINFHNKLEEVVKFSMQTWEDSKRSLTIEEIINNTISY